MFASETVLEHLARGVVGLSAFAGAVALATKHPFAALALVALGLVALRGCPMCWTMGLVETVAAKISGGSAKGACVDGSCSFSKLR